MPYELEKEKIILSEGIARDKTQILLEGDIIVPDIKPDISYILKTDGKVSIDNIETNTDRVTFSGKLEINVLYLSKSEDRPVNNINTSLLIEDFINIDGLTKEMIVDLDCQLIHLDYKLVNDRKINFKAVSGAVAKASATFEHEVVTNITGLKENQIMKSNLKINRLVSNKEDKFVIKDELSVPSGKPNIREVLNCGVSIINKDSRVTDDKVSIKGDLLIKTLYIGDTEDSVVEYMEHELPFNGSVDIESVAEEMYADVLLKIKDQYTQVRPDIDGEDRGIEVEVSVGVIAKVFCESEISMVEDAFCNNKNTKMIKSNVKYPKVISRNKNQLPIRETIILPDKNPKIMQVYTVSGNIKIDDIKVLDDKVIIEGIIDSTMIYIAESDNTPLYSYSSTIPINQTIEVKGAKEYMNVELDNCIAHTSFNMLSSTEVETRFVLDLTAVVIDDKEIELITDMEFEDLDKSVVDNIASLTVYIVSQGDTMWKIAKKYNSTIDDLIALNEIDDSYKIYPGQKLLVLKKAYE